MRYRQTKNASLSHLEYNLPQGKSKENNVDFLLVCTAFITCSDDRGMIVKPYTQINDFWASDGDRTRNLLMTDETLRPLSYQDSHGEPRCKFDIYVWPRLPRRSHIQGIPRNVYIFWMIITPTSFLSNATHSWPIWRRGVLFPARWSTSPLPSWCESLS